MGNSCLTVNPDEVVVVEKCGAFSHVAEAGCHCLGCDVLPGCITTHNCSLRMFEVKSETELVLDEYFIVNYTVTAQISVDPSRAYEAIYSLKEPNAQIASQIKSIVRGVLCPDAGSQRVFRPGEAQAKEMIKDALQDAISQYGYQVHAVQVAMFYPKDTPRWVVNASQALPEAQLARKNAYETAQGRKNYVVFQAQAARDCKILQGEGAARQMIAIAEGLKRDLGGDQELSVKAMTDLILMTQHFDSLQQMAEQDTTIMMPMDLGYVKRLAHDIDHFSSRPAPPSSPPKQMGMKGRQICQRYASSDTALQRTLLAHDARLQRSFGRQARTQDAGHWVDRRT